MLESDGSGISFVLYIAHVAFLSYQMPPLHLLTLNFLLHLLNHQSHLLRPNLLLPLQPTITLKLSSHLIHSPLHPLQSLTLLLKMNLHQSLIRFFPIIFLSFD
jgi:hypothetical protein